MLTMMKSEGRQTQRDGKMSQMRQKTKIHVYKS